LTVALTAAIFWLILRRVPLAALGAALRDADYARFLALMIPNALFYFAWDTLVLAIVIRWFHGGVPYRRLLPVRAASYVVGFFNTNLGRGAMAAYLSRQLHAPFLELGSTVIFLVLTEYTQLVLWAMLGLLGLRTEVSRSLFIVAAGVAARLVDRPDVPPGDARALRADRPAAGADVFRLALRALLRGAGVRHPNSFRPDADVPAGDLHAGGIAGHRGASGHDPGGLDLLLQPVRSGAAPAGDQPGGAPCVFLDAGDARRGLAAGRVFRSAAGAPQPE